MKQTFLWFSLLFATVLATDYQCLPYPIASACVIDYVFYRPGDLISFPTGYQQFHIRPPRSDKKVVSKVTIFDEKLYQALHKPSSIEMINLKMEQLILPSELLLGNFADNSLKSVNVTDGRSYQITYLDLKSNSLPDIDFVRNLVNLEMLHLEYNMLNNISGSALSPLKKLKYLYLQHNFFAEIPWSDVPHSLIHLDCYASSIETVEFTNVSLPSLEYLNLQHNDLLEINVTALLWAAPKLREAYLHNDQIDGARLDEIKAELTSNNISFKEANSYSSCFYDDNYEFVDGTCRKRPDQVVSPSKAAVLSVVVIGIAVAFVYIVVIVLKHMNR